MGVHNQNGTGFKYDIDAPRVQLSNSQLLTGLRRFAGLHGPRPFTIKEFNAWRDRPCCADTIVSRFGSWREALRSVGIHGGRARRYSPAELVANLERVWQELGRPPGNKTLPQRGQISAGAYRTHWGSVRRACLMLARFHRGEIARATLLSADDGRPRRKGVPLGVRWRIIKRDRHRCAACGRGPATHAGVDLHVDHVVPVSKGGGNEETNLRTLCAACNVGRGNES